LPPETLESAVFSLSKPLFATICSKPNPGFATPKVEARNKLETALNQVSSYILVSSGPVVIRVLRVSLVIGAELRFPTVFAQAIDNPVISPVISPEGSEFSFRVTFQCLSTVSPCWFSKTNFAVTNGRQNV